MSPFDTSNEFKRLEKIAELEKRIAGEIKSTRDENGKIGLSDIDGSKLPIPDRIRRVMIVRGKTHVPAHILNSLMDEGHDSIVSHLSKHKIMMTPGEALYTARGRKSNDIFDDVKNITLGEILALAKNKAAVHGTCGLQHMQLDDFDMPRHVKILKVMRGMSPDDLHKHSSNIDSYGSNIDSIKFEFSNGLEVTHSRKSAKKNSAKIQDWIDDGIIIKVVQILSSGKENTVFNKYASFGADDSLYIEMLSSMHGKFAK